MFDGLLLEGVLLPLRTASALVPALAAGLLVGAMRARGTPTGTPAARDVLPPLISLTVGAVAGLVFPTFASADALSLAGLALGVALCAAVALARTPPAPFAYALVACAAFLAARTSFGRFLPGELPPAVHAGALVGIVGAATAVAVAVATARRLAPGPVTAIGTRVAASWLAAVALLMVALAAAPR